jgi:hemoglobin-like flavoprotein
LLINFDPAIGCSDLRELSMRHMGYGLTEAHYNAFKEVLIKSIEESGVTQPAELAAWRAAVTPAIEFMRMCQPISSAVADSGAS